MGRRRTQNLQKITCWPLCVYRTHSSMCIVLPLFAPTSMSLPQSTWQSRSDRVNVMICHDAMAESAGAKGAHGAAGPRKFRRHPTIQQRSRMEYQCKATKSYEKLQIVQRNSLEDLEVISDFYVRSWGSEVEPAACELPSDFFNESAA